MRSNEVRGEIEGRREGITAEADDWTEGLNRLKNGFRGKVALREGLVGPSFQEKPTVRGRDSDGCTGFGLRSDSTNPVPYSEPS